MTTPTSPLASHNLVPFPLPPTSPRFLRGDFLRLYEQVNAEAVHLLDTVVSLTASQEERMLVRGRLAALGMQADILRYHINHNLCRQEDGRLVADAWTRYALDLQRQQEAATLDPLAVPFACGAAAVYEAGARFLRAVCTSTSAEGEEAVEEKEDEAKPR